LQLLKFQPSYVGFVFILGYIIFILSDKHRVSLPALFRHACKRLSGWATLVR